MGPVIPVVLVGLLLLLALPASAKVEGMEVDSVFSNQSHLFPPDLPWYGALSQERIRPEACPELRATGGGVPCHLYAEHGVVCWNFSNNACLNETAQASLSVYVFSNASDARDWLRNNAGGGTTGLMPGLPLENVLGAPGEDAVRSTYIGAYTHTYYRMLYRNFGIYYYVRTLDPAPADLNRTLVQAVMGHLLRVNLSALPIFITPPGVLPIASPTPRQPGFEALAVVIALGTATFCIFRRR